MTQQLVINSTKYIDAYEKRIERLNASTIYSSVSISYLTSLNANVQNTFDDISFLRNVQSVLINEVASVNQDFEDFRKLFDEQSVTPFDKTKIEEAQKLKLNIYRLSEIRKLADNWDGYNAKPLDTKLIDLCIELISSHELDYQPDIYPTLDGNIQFEYEPSKDRYLELQISQHCFTFFQKINRKVIKGTTTDWSNIVRLIDELFS